MHLKENIIISVYSLVDYYFFPLTVVVVLVVIIIVMNNNCEYVYGNNYECLFFIFILLLKYSCFTNVVLVCGESAICIHISPP